MKKIFIICFAIFGSVVLAQSPQKVSYQAVVRDANNQLLTNQAIGMQISIIKGTVSGTAVYVETQTPTTNSNGLISIEIGTGTTTDNFIAIDWANGLFFIKTEIDLAGGTNYTITGSSQLLSVPYAFYANHAGMADTVVGDINELDPAFESWDKSTGITITESQVSDLKTYLTTEVDASVTNELQMISISNDTIFLSNGGYVKLPASVGFSGSFNDLSDIPANLDTDDTDDFDGAYSSLSGAPTNVSSFTNDAGYLTSEVDGSTTNEIELPVQTGNSGKMLTTNGTSPSWSAVSFNDLSDVPANLDTDDTDDFDGAYSSLSGAPTNVSSFTNDAGYLTSEVDGSTTNEIELPVQTGHSGKYLTTDGSSVSWAVVSGSSTNVTTISANTTLTNSNEIVFINGAYIATFPASPTDGQRIVVCGTNTSAGVNGNGKTLYLANSTFTGNLLFSDGGVKNYTFYYSSTLGVWLGIY